MYTYIILGSVCLSGVLYNFSNFQANNTSLPSNSDVKKILKSALKNQMSKKSHDTDRVKRNLTSEGPICKWNGIKGTCVKETRCLSSLDRREPKQFVCPQQGEETVVCCTDCELVNNTRDAVVVPSGSLFWKNGNKARDYCLQYINELPYQCKEDGDQGGINMRLDKEKKCHVFDAEAIREKPCERRGVIYPHQALLNFPSWIGEDPFKTTTWITGGTIISDRYILTGAWTAQINEPTAVAVNVSSSSSWQLHKVKRVILHPHYWDVIINDIALVETETPIKFDKHVLPACLHVEDVSTDRTIATTLRSPTGQRLNALRTIPLEKSTDEECLATFPYDGYNNTIHMCYRSKMNPEDACKGTDGEPLLVDNQFSNCVHTVVGLILGYSGSNICNLYNGLVPFTKIAAYIPWIESIVWP